MVMGLLTGLLSSLILSIVLMFRKKKDRETATKQVQRDIAKNVLANKGFNSSIKFEFDYSSLYNELECKCNPSNYLNPYDPQKVEVSNSIYSQLKEKKLSTYEIIALRNRAIKELNIEYSSKELYDKLSQIFNPSKFVNENYDAVKLDAVNKVYSKIQNYKNNIVELESIAIDNQIDILSTCNEEKDEDKEGIVTKQEKIALILVLCYLIVLIIIGCVLSNDL